MIDQSANADALHWRFSFLQTLRETGNVSAAARHVGKSRAAVYRARKKDDGFAADWDDALEEAADRAFDRAGLAAPTQNYQSPNHYSPNHYRKECYDAFVITGFTWSHF